MLQLFDLEGRLVARQLDESAVWSAEKKAWRRSSTILARKAWLEGEELTRGAAARRFPEADLEAIPDLTKPVE